MYVWLSYPYVFECYTKVPVLYVSVWVIFFFFFIVKFTHEIINLIMDAFCVQEYSIVFIWILNSFIWIWICLCVKCFVYLMVECMFHVWMWLLDNIYYFLVFSDLNKKICIKFNESKWKFKQKIGYKFKEGCFLTKCQKTGVLRS